MSSIMHGRQAGSLSYHTDIAPTTSGCAKKPRTTRFTACPSRRSLCTLLEPHGCSVQIVLIGALDLHGRNFTHAQRPPARDIDRAVDLRCIAFAAALGDARARRIDDHLLAAADLAFEPSRRHGLLARHEPMPARLFDVVRNRSSKVVGSRALHWLIAEAADAIELGCVEPIEELLEVGVGLARESDDESRADGELWTDRAPCPDALERFFLRGRPPHALEHVRTCVLKRDIEIG